MFNLGKESRKRKRMIRTTTKEVTSRLSSFIWEGEDDLTRRKRIGKEEVGLFHSGGEKPTGRGKRKRIIVRGRNNIKKGRLWATNRSKTEESVGKRAATATF